MYYSSVFADFCGELENFSNFFSWGKGPDGESPELPMGFCLGSKPHDLLGTFDLNHRAGIFRLLGKLA